MLSPDAPNSPNDHAVYLLPFSWLSNPLISAIIGGSIVALSNHLLQTRREYVRLKQQKADEIIMASNKLIFLSNAIGRKCYLISDSRNDIISSLSSSVKADFDDEL